MCNLLCVTVNDCMCVCHFLSLYLCVCVLVYICVRECICVSESICMISCVCVCVCVCVLKEYICNILYVFLSFFLSLSVCLWLVMCASLRAFVRVCLFRGLSVLESFMESVCVYVFVCQKGVYV